MKWKSESISFLKIFVYWFIIIFAFFALFISTKQVNGWSLMIRLSMVLMPALLTALLFTLTLRKWWLGIVGISLFNIILAINFAFFPIKGGLGLEWLTILFGLPLELVSVAILKGLQWVYKKYVHWKWTPIIPYVIFVILFIIGLFTCFFGIDEYCVGKLDGKNNGPFIPYASSIYKDGYMAGSQDPSQCWKTLPSKYQECHQEYKGNSEDIMKATKEQAQFYLDIDWGSVSYKEFREVQNCSDETFFECLAEICAKEQTSIYGCTVS